MNQSVDRTFRKAGYERLTAVPAARAEDGAPTASASAALALRIRARISQLGWRTAAGVFVFYLVRDLLLYVALPLVAGTWGFGFWK